MSTSSSLLSRAIPTAPTITSNASELPQHIGNRTQLLNRPHQPLSAQSFITDGEDVRVSLSLPGGVVPSKLVPMIHGVLPPRIERL